MQRAQHDGEEREEGGITLASRDQEVALLCAIRLVFHETLCTVHPSTADGFVSAQEVGVRDVESPHRGAPVVRRLEIPLVGGFPHYQ